MNEVEYFMNDIGVFTSGNVNQHLSIVHQVLLWLEESGFTVNTLKCAWTVQSTDYLGFILPTSGIKPLPQKLRQ